MPLQKILFKAGVNRENTRYTTEGGWYECDKVRFRQGTPEKIGGWVQISPYTYEGVCRSLWTWSTLIGTVLTGVGTNLKFYIEEGGGYNDVTPIRSSVTLNGPFSAIVPQNFTVTIANPAVLTTSALATVINGMAFTFTTTGNLPTGLATGVTYYAVNSAGNTCSLALTPDGDAIATTGTQSGTHSLTSTTVTVVDTSHGASDNDYVIFFGAQALSTQTFTRSTATEFVLTSALATNTPVVLSVSYGGSLPTGLYEGSVYYIKVVSGTTVSFANVPDGAAVTTTTAGSGTFSLYVSSGITANVLNQTHKINLVDANTYTINVSTAATVYDTGNGGTTVNANYEIPVGYETAQPISGWGAGPWGSGAWGVGDSSFINLRLWYQSNFGENLIYGYRGSPLYYWEASTGTTPMTFTATLDTRTVTSVDIATEYLSVSTANLTNGTPVKFSSTASLPSPLAINTVYYIININGAGANTLQVSSSYGGTAVNLTSTGSGTISMYGPTLFSVAGSYGNGQAIQLTSSGTLPTPLDVGTVYYTINSTGGTFYMSTTAGGYPIVCTNNSLATTYYILPNGILVSSLAYASDVPSAVNFMMVSDVSRFTIAFGCNPIDDTDIDPMLIRWTDQESVVNWTPEPTNQAGGQRISHGSKIVTAIQARQEIVVFTDTSVYSMQYLGPPYVWGFQLLGDNISIISPNATTIASGVVYWMGVDKFYKYDGRTQTLRCDLRQYIYSDINLDQADQVFCGTNEGFNEVWWFYCSAGTTASPNSIIDKYVVYNYAEDIWHYGTIGRTAWVDSGLNNYPIGATYSNNLVYHENGVDDNTSGTPVPIDASITSSQFDIGDGHAFGFVWRLIPDITFRGSTAENPQVTMTLLPAQNSGSGYNVPQSEGGSSNALVTSGSYTAAIEEFTGQVLIRVRGRQMAFKVQSVDTGVQWQLGAPRIDIKPDGRRGNT